MEYVSRRLEPKFVKMSGLFKAILVTGARQVGKTTVLKNLAEDQERTYVTPDNKMARELAQTGPVLFFKRISRRLRLMKFNMRLIYFHK